MLKYFFLAILGVAASVYPALAAEGPLAIGIDEHLGAMLPLDEIVLTDEEGARVLLRALMAEKPTILSLMYYRCPGLCTPLLGGVIDLVDAMRLRPGKDYQLLTVSFASEEGPDLAREKRMNAFKALRQPIPPEGWRFLTGDGENIARLTQAVGFGFEKKGEDYLHTATLIALSPEGKVARYLYAGARESMKVKKMYFLSRDVELALLEAADGRVGPTVTRILRYCFSYDPEGKTYVFKVTQVAGGIITAFGLGFFLWISFGKKKKP